MKAKYLQRGFTLIEVIIFIVVMGIISITILASMSLVARNIPTMKNQVIANQIAMSAIEWYLGQRYYKGYNSGELSKCTDTKGNSMSSPTFLTIPNNYSVNITCYPPPKEGCPGKTITVSVTGLSKAKLSICLADY